MKAIIIFLLLQLGDIFDTYANIIYEQFNYKP
jgi:hypothetical protein